MHWNYSETYRDSKGRGEVIDVTDDVSEGSGDGTACTRAQSESYRPNKPTRAGPSTALGIST